VARVVDLGKSRVERGLEHRSWVVGAQLLGRSLPAAPGTDPADAIRRYLNAGRTDSAKALAAKAVVLIHPQNRAGEIAWPATSRPRR
jgi:hypothetical protein